MPPNPLNVTPKSGGSSKGSSKPGVRSGSRARGASPPQQVLPPFSISPTLFDPTFLDKINLNDPARRALWVEAVWRFFINGGRPSSDTSSIRSASFAAAPSPTSPTTPTIPHFRSMTFQHHSQGGSEHELMDGLETYSQEAQSTERGNRNSAILDYSGLPQGSLPYAQEQWRNI